MDKAPRLKPHTMQDLSRLGQLMYHYAERSQPIELARKGHEHDSYTLPVLNPNDPQIISPVKRRIE